MKKSTLFVTLASVALLLTSIVYTRIAISNNTNHIEPSPEEQAQQIKVSIIKSSAKTYRAKMHLYGELQAVNSLSLKSQISTQVNWLNPNFRNGALVNKGDVLATFEDTEYRVQLNSAKAKLASAYVALQTEKRKTRQAKNEFKRSGLTKKGSPLLMRKPQLAAAIASYKDEKTRVELAKYYLAQTKLVAPFDAVVSKRAISVGSYLTIGSDIAQLDDISRSQVSLTLNQRQLDLLPRDLSLIEVELWNAQSPTARFSGKLVSLDSQLQNTSRLRRIVIEVADPLATSSPLLNGSFVKVEISGRSIDNLFALPSSTLSADGYLWTVQQGLLSRRAKQPVFSEERTLYFAQEDMAMKIEAVEFPLLSFESNMRVSAVDFSSQKQKKQQEKTSE